MKLGYLREGRKGRTVWFIRPSEAEETGHEPKLRQPRLLLEEDYNVKAAELRSFIVELTPARHHGVKTATAHFSSRAKINKNRALIVPNFL